jgi:hypothetical protein
MRTDKRKLEELFIFKLFDLFPGLKKLESEAWEAYIKGIGCRLVHTPDGMLPTRSPNIVHIEDPGSVKIDEDGCRVKAEWHIQIPRETALKILTLGLP